MMTKRILSCLAIASIAFILSCYDVKYDDDNTSNTSNWTEGLTPQQIIEGNEIQGSISDVVKKADEVTTEIEKDVEITWEWPLDQNEPTWEVTAQIDEGSEEVIYNGKIYSDGSEESTKSIKSSSKAGSIQFSTVEFKTSTGLIYFFLKFKVKINAPQQMLKVFVKMIDSNNKTYWNIVTFLVAPNDMNCIIRPGISEASVTSKLFRNQLSIIQGVDFLLNPSHTDYLYQNTNQFTPDLTSTWNITAKNTVFFGIETDFSNKGYGFGIVRHLSSSSYCKVSKVAAANGAVATLEYKFEDLPKDRLRFEDGKRFDYDDVIFYVDLYNK